MTQPTKDTDSEPPFDPTPGRDTEFEREASAAAAIAEAVAETEATLVVERALAGRERRLLLVMGALLGMSLLLHAITLSRLFSIRATLRQEIGRLADSVATAKDQTLSYDLPINQSIPINISIPIRESVVIPVNTTVQIKQNITVPIDTGFGVVDLPVPLDVNIPISTTVPIEFNQDVPISTTLPVSLTVPIQLDLGSSQFAAPLDTLRDALLQFRDQF